ncbi:MAG TPA: DNA repair protein RadA, partial [Gammaproteobacteria bacterium]|nr:DNA repair protein RadA [Gammaproteobacteria bacterium]
MARQKTLYSCSECGAQAPKWAGQCGECGAWNTLIEVVAPPADKARGGRFGGYAGVTSELTVTSLAEVESGGEIPRIPCGLSELDHVLGGGLVPGSVVVIGGDPGIGKSTILLQTLATLAQQIRTLYVTGEESPQQISLRGKRLDLPLEGVRLLTETQVERIIALAAKERPQVMVIDSIQTIHTELLQSAPGSVAQVRESAAQLVRFAKQSGIAMFLVGHVTKEGQLAGPRVL